MPLHPTFMDRYMAGEVGEDTIDECVDAWHTSDTPLSLMNYLGMTWPEYEQWMRDAGVLPAILEARRQQDSE